MKLYRFTFIHGNYDVGQAVVVDEDEQCLCCGEPHQYEYDENEEEPCMNCGHLQNEHA